MKYICVKKCFFQGRRWKVGEAMTSERKDIPPYFAPAARVRIVKTVQEGEPRTLGEVESKSIDPRTVLTKEPEVVVEEVPKEPDAGEDSEAAVGGEAAADPDLFS